jgi:OOP family OmpA-OmpF porin
MVAVAALASVGSVTGCKVSAEGKIGSGEAKAPPPPPPAPEPAPEPAPAPAVAEVPVFKASDMKLVGKATIEGDEIKIPGKIEFDVDKATIRENKESLEILRTMADVIKQNNVTKIRIEGHTDDSGSSEHNHKLSKARADAVADWLAKNGVDRSRIETVGLGEERPIAKNDTPANKQLNRRTEFHVIEVDGKPFGAPNATAATPPQH